MIPWGSTSGKGKRKNFHWIVWKRKLPIFIYITSIRLSPFLYKRSYILFDCSKGWESYKISFPERTGSLWMIPRGSKMEKERKNFHWIVWKCFFCINEICCSVAREGERVTKFPSLAKNDSKKIDEWKGKKERTFTGYGNINFLTYPPFCTNDNTDIYFSVAWEGERITKFPSLKELDLSEWFQEDRKWKKKERTFTGYGNVNFLTYPPFCTNDNTDIYFSVAREGERVTKFPSLKELDLSEWFQEDRKWKKKERIFTGSYGNAFFV